MPLQGDEGLLSPFLRSKRIKAVLPYLKGKVLDIGCGSGDIAKYVSPKNYLGVDIDLESIKESKTRYPLHIFYEDISFSSSCFDTIIALAVIEHVEDPVLFLKDLSLRLEKSKESLILITTPHPISRCIHSLGSKIKLFSGHANDEHKMLFNKHKMKEIAVNAGLEIVFYKRFLFWSNQVFTLKIRE